MSLFPGLFFIVLCYVVIMRKSYISKETFGEIFFSLWTFFKQILTTEKAIMNLTSLSPALIIVNFLSFLFYAHPLKSHLLLWLCWWLDILKQVSTISFISTSVCISNQGGPLKKPPYYTNRRK